jgi:hypothetical protein
MSLEVFDSKGRQLGSADIELAMLAVAAGLVAKTNEFKDLAIEIKPGDNLLIVFADPAICGDFIARTEAFLKDHKTVLEGLVRSR